MSELLEGFPLATADPDERVIVGLSVAIGILADASGEHDLVRAVQNLIVEWAKAKGLLVHGVKG